MGEEKRVLRLEVESIRPNPRQPRRLFDEGALRELAASIRRHGVVQPLVVRRRPDGWELVAGERRLRAARLEGQQGGLPLVHLRLHAGHRRKARQDRKSVV